MYLVENVKDLGLTFLSFSISCLLKYIAKPYGKSPCQMSRINELLHVHHV